MSVKYVIGHWTAGGYMPNSLDKESYQLIVAGDGSIYKGFAVGKTSSTGGMNSVTYNIACCGGLPTSKITKIQFESFCRVCAEKLQVYTLTSNEFYTHAEIGEMCRDKSITKLLVWNGYLSQNIGKVDLTVLPYEEVPPSQTGAFIRNKIKWYMDKI